MFNTILMSKKSDNLMRSFACFVALVQLCAAPATHSLHVGCDHSTHDRHEALSISVVASCFSASSCSCAHHGPEHSSDKSSESDQPHDQHSCGICRVAFATFTFDFYQPLLTEIGTISALSEVDVAVPELAPAYCRKSRGPPPSLAIT